MFDGLVGEVGGLGAVGDAALSRYTYYYWYILVLMPISIDAFEEGSDQELRRRGTNSEAILTFLVEHPDKAFTPAEIAERASVTRNSVGPVLSRLEERGLVRHKGMYWAIGEGSEVERLASTLATSRAMTERFGPEDPDEWK